MVAATPPKATPIPTAAPTIVAATAPTRPSPPMAPESAPVTVPAARVRPPTAPDAPLRSWRAALDMIAQPPQRFGMARDDGRTPEQRLAAFERFLQLQQWLV